MLFVALMVDHSFRLPVLVVAEGALVCNPLLLHELLLRRRHLVLIGSAGRELFGHQDGGSTLSGLHVHECLVLLFGALCHQVV